MAWSEKLPSGRYRGVYRDAAGKRRSAGTFPHKARAEREAAALEGKSRRSSWHDPDAAKRTWGEWADEWWPTRNVEASTLKVDLSRRTTHLDPRWSDVPIGSIRRHDVRAWAASMRRKGVSAATAQRAVHLLSASLNAAVDAEVLESNPAARLSLPPSGEGTERFLTVPEYEQIQAQMPTTEDQLVAHFLAFTGVRWGELAGLHSNRLDLERCTVYVQEVYDGKHNVIKPYPKGRRAREVPLPAWLVDLLEDQEPAPCKVPHTSGRCRGRLVFHTSRGAVLEGSKWSRVWRDAVSRAGVDHARIHDLRHSYASWLIQEGRPLAEIGQLLGHKSAATTQRYAHLADLRRSEVLAVLPTPQLVAPILPHEAVAVEAASG